MNLRIAAPVLALMMGCSNGTPTTARCLDAVAAPQSEVERRVLADAKARTRRICEDPQRQCSHAVRAASDGFHVFVQFASVEAETGECLHLAGDHELHLYDAAGMHAETWPGM